MGLKIKGQYRYQFKNVIQAAHSYFNSKSLSSILATPRIKFACGILAIIVPQLKFRPDYLVGSDPVILPLLEALHPLFKLPNNLLNSCYEAQECLKLFDDVRESIVLFSLNMNKTNIQFNHLHYYYQNKDGYQEFLKISKIVKVDVNTIKIIESMICVYEEFIEVRKEITEIMLPSCFTDGKWH